MKINRLALKAAVEKALADNEERHVKQTIEWHAWLTQYRKQWLEKNGPVWISVVANIEKAIRAGEPISESLLPSRYDACWRDPEVWAGRQRDTTTGVPGKPTKVYRPDSELVALKEVLDMIVDDEVTATGLRSLGITPQTLRNCVLKLGANAKVSE